MGCETKADKRKTNYDNIHNMDIDELAEFLKSTIVCYGCPCKCGYLGADCKSSLLRWLESEARK